ncbi:PorT family protein [Hymenobacter sp. BT175]|uniref:porin family protein n=1 Tax=Hymenobacter translucens TaxID=2886507 RepID=UPI001D0EC8CF|nr:porin family protein [Hymenobacter translucens]MCC2547342.1 PorT family protein [Hymenobacter translucens]
MKKLLLILSCCVAATGAFAQDGPIGVPKSTDYAPDAGNDSRNTGFGVKGGFNLADVYGDNADNYKDQGNVKTFHAGVYGQYGFNSRISMQTELLYSRQGFKGGSTYSPTTGTSTTVNERRLDYLQLPVLVVFNVLDNVSLHAGPQVSLLTKVQEDGKDRKIANENNNAGTPIYGYSYSSLDYGLSAGAEARVGPARVGARYTAGFADIIKEQVKTSTSTALNDIRNNVFQVYVGIGFAR